MDKQNKGKTNRRYHWVYMAPESKQVLFDYQEGRGREGPQELLKHFKGNLQTDGYEVYNSFAHRKEIMHLHCMAHARRKFDEALSNDRARAEYALKEIQKLYAIERRCKEEFMSAEQVQEVREKKQHQFLIH